MSIVKNIVSYLGILSAGFLLMAGQAAYAGVVGNVQFVSGNVQITNAAGQSRVLQKGDVIHESDTVTTAKASSAQIKMRDGGLIAVRPDSKLKFDSFEFSGEQDGTEKSVMTLLKGGMRAITGLIGQLHKANYHINTASSTIGIRGTDHETYVVVPGSELAATIPAGTYNKVNTGETVMTTDKGSVNILPNQMGFVSAMDQTPQLQPINLNLFTVSPSPMPQATGEKGQVRDSAAVDNAVQDQGGAPVNTVPENHIQTPIKGGAVGGTSPQKVF